MDKKTMVMIGPFGTVSGYGAHARDIFHSFYDSGKFDIQLMDTPWGGCPRNALKPGNAKDKIVLDAFADKVPDIQPDICVDVRIPNEFQPIGKFNIGITAGIETTAVSQKWIEGCNKMDLIIVPSEHSKSGFVNTIYDKVQQLPNGEKQKVGEDKLEKPMEVAFEGVHAESYFPLDEKKIESGIYDIINDMVPEEKAFLFVGQWVHGNYGEDRKDIGRMIKIFFETFLRTKNPPALVLKSHGADFSILDREEIFKKINDVKKQFPSLYKLPNVYLLHGELTTEQMNGLYNHPKFISMVSFTHGEGFGRPLLEATFADLPVIASAWSGQLDFLDSEHSILVKGDLVPIPKSAVWKDILIEHSQWFTVNEASAAQCLKFAFENTNDFKDAAVQLGKINRKKYKHSDMTKVLVDIFDKHYEKQPKQVSMNLPKLKKKSTLPKLEKKSTTEPQGAAV